MRKLSKLVPVCLACALSSSPALAKSLPPTDQQLDGAMHDLMNQNSVATTAHDRLCASLPIDKRIRDALKFADDSAMIPMPGLTHGVTALNGWRLRAAYCVPQPPPTAETGKWKAWEYQNFEVPRGTVPDPMHVLKPGPVTTTVPDSRALRKLPAPS